MTAELAFGSARSGEYFMTSDAKVAEGREQKRDDQERKAICVALFRHPLKLYFS